MTTLFDQQPDPDQPKPSLLDGLCEMRRLLQIGWCQNAVAIDAQGHSVGASSPQARCFCLYGARLRAVHNLNQTNDYAFREALCQAIEDAIIQLFGLAHSAPTFNDLPTTSLPLVLQVIDRAIQNAAPSG